MSLFCHQLMAKDAASFASTDRVKPEGNPSITRVNPTIASMCARIGQEALRQHSLVLVGLASVVRSRPELVMCLVGLVLLAASAIMTALAI